MYEFFKQNRLFLEEYNLKKQIGIDFWHTSVLNEQRVPIAGGSGYSLDQSRKIAYSECLERLNFFKLKQSSAKTCEEWGINLISSGCGFAAGFNEYNTITRSMGEAVERWTMSKWIDDEYFIEKADSDKVLHELDPASQWFYKQFDKVDFYKKSIMIQQSDQFFLYSIAFAIAFKDNGIFPGSSYNQSDKPNWHHALVETYRHLLVYKNNSPTNSFPDNKIRYFATNADVAQTQINRANKIEWPIPQINLQRCQKFENPECYLARTIIGGWQPWNEGPVERFLY